MLPATLNPHVLAARRTAGSRKLPWLRQSLQGSVEHRAALLLCRNHSVRQLAPGMQGMLQLDFSRTLISLSTAREQSVVQWKLI